MKKRIIICDIDGTIADLNHRLHFIKNEDGTKKRGAAADWKSFHAGCADDAPITDVIEIVKSLAVGRNVFFVSGRNATARAETEQWIKKYFNFKWAEGCNLFMRKGHDFRPDTVVKLEMVRELGITPDQVECILDDRQCVVDMWRENGFRCLQVTAWRETDEISDVTQPR
tara:strand:+ start:811 stop:1320 length:510 start_codon:yes stop_codon:yes gene_type:complete